MNEGQNVMVNPVSFGPLRPIEERSPVVAKRGGEPAQLQPTPSTEQSKSSVPPTKLTALARELADAGPPVDYARIAQIRQAISNGGYHVDAQAIAGAMLRHFQINRP
jgi:flagellar biosynthesis anti-sigma factor FlgM